jgi:hypothetical protein
MTKSPPPSAAQRGRRGWFLLLVLPFVATLFPQYYAGAEPSLGGIPFFYWYQLLWVVITGLLTILVLWLSGVARPAAGNRRGRNAP